MSQDVFFNGINGTTGMPLDNFQLTTDMLAKIARHHRLTEDDLRDARLRSMTDRSSTYDFGVSEGIKIDDLSQTGWGVIFPSSLPQTRVDALKDALKPLLDLRKEQATKNNPDFYMEFVGPERGFRDGETKNDFLKRFGCGLGKANPKRGVPFYLLLVGSPQEIPFIFQYQLDVEYGVGRIYFSKTEEYARYAQSVVDVETKKVVRPKSAAFWSTMHDRPTRLGTTRLIKPLTEQVSAEHPDWDIRRIDPMDATKVTLDKLMGGDETPALLFTVSHGLRFDLDDNRLLSHTGALLCQDIFGYEGGSISEKYYFSADDISQDANVFGSFAFFFACYGAGVPQTDNFYRMVPGEKKVLAPYDFLSAMPLKLLSHPKGGALGVFAHVDRAWTYSFAWDNDLAVNDTETFKNMISALFNGKPAGAATDYFGGRFAEISTLLNEELDQTTDNHEDDSKIAMWWMFNNDARNYTFIGDPAVRLAVKS